MSGATKPGVLFDVDGTLLDTNYLHVLAWSRALRENGHDGVNMARIHRAVGIASEGLVRHLVATDDEEAVEAHSARYAELRDHVRAFPRAGDLLAACASRGFTVVLATSGKEHDLEWMLPAIGAGDSVSGVTTSSEVAEGKPEPDLLATALEGHDLDPGRTALVGDTVWDVGAASRAGLPCITLTSGGVSAAELRDAGAAEVYDDPADLLSRFEDSLLAELLRRPASRR